MEKSSFAMAKFGLESKEAMPKRDCGFYVKYIFLFTSLIQFLIILGLVLFMVYGNVQAGTDTHLRLLEEQVQSHYRRIVTLGATNANLSRALNATLKERDKLQGLTLKVQRELERCNSSSQVSTSIPQLQERVFQQMKLAECHMVTSFLNATCNNEKLQLQQQLDQATSSKRSLETSGQQSQAELARASAERERCLQDLQRAQAEGEFSRAQLQLQQHQCNGLQGELSAKLPRLQELLQQGRCTGAEQELRQVREGAERLLRQQQDKDERFVWRQSCELSVQQCQLNCSRQRQELERRAQALEARERAGAEERRRLEAQRERAAREHEERRRAAESQAERLRERLGECLGTKVPHLELPSPWVPGGAARSGSFPSPSSYLEFLRNTATAGTMGKKNLEELQRMQQLMEQYTATLRSLSG